MYYFLYATSIQWLMISLCVLQPSFDKVLPPTSFELGLGQLVGIYDELCDIGKPPPVIDAKELQKDPEVFELYEHA